MPRRARVVRAGVAAHCGEHGCRERGGDRRRRGGWRGGRRVVLDTEQRGLGREVVLGRRVGPIAAVSCRQRLPRRRGCLPAHEAARRRPVGVHAKRSELREGRALQEVSHHRSVTAPRVEQKLLHEPVELVSPLGQIFEVEVAPEGFTGQHGRSPAFRRVPERAARGQLGPKLGEVGKAVPDMPAPVHRVDHEESVARMGVLSHDSHVVDRHFAGRDGRCAHAHDGGVFNAVRPLAGWRARVAHVVAMARCERRERRMASLAQSRLGAVGGGVDEQIAARVRPDEVLTPLPHADHFALHVVGGASDVHPHGAVFGRVAQPAASPAYQDECDDVHRGEDRDCNHYTLALLRKT
mmetsp:Transcript_54245/g.149607  ORF Transcript_54245/g.149607 Transcript_54245/m.149607 type:complete len:352 (+) Transcript_54245:199-1254(+)